MKTAFLDWLRELVVAPFEGDRETLATVPLQQEERQARRDEQARLLMRRH